MNAPRSRNALLRRSPSVVAPIREEDEDDVEALRSASGAALRAAPGSAVGIKSTATKIRAAKERSAFEGRCIDSHKGANARADQVEVEVEPLRLDQGGRERSKVRQRPIPGSPEHSGCENNSLAANLRQVRKSRAAQARPKGSSPLSEQTGGEQERGSAAPPRDLISHVANGADEPKLSAAAMSNLAEDKWSKLNNLALLYEQGFILETEFKERRSQLIDELTGTRSTMGDTGTSSTTAETARRVRRLRRPKSRKSSSIVVPRPPPSNFEIITAERAIKHYFDLATRTWNTQEVYVRIDDTPFARGGLRLVYHLQDVSAEDYFATLAESDGEDDLEIAGDGGAEGADGAPRYRTRGTTETTVSTLGTPGAEGGTGCAWSSGAVACADSAQADGHTVRRAKRTSYVAKIAIDPNEDPSTYFRDVEAQAHCAHYAELFNTYKPPRLVEFVSAWVLELTDRQGSPLCAVEKFVPGSYKKHNNNYGYVSEDVRNTPQAFSHFTYEASAHTMLVVDIQGVDASAYCSYTDPQIHTLNQEEFGKGNLGIRGFHKFLSTHQCNAICRYLKLPPVNPRYTMEGTIPNLPFMPATKINRSHFKEGHYFEATPALRNLVKAKAKARRRKRRQVAVREASGEEDTLEDDEGGEEHDSFLHSHLWDTRGDAGGMCSFCPCTIL